MTHKLPGLNYMSNISFGSTAARNHIYNSYSASSTQFTVFLCVHRYEGTGRSLSLKLVQQLRQQSTSLGNMSAAAASAAVHDKSSTSSATGENMKDSLSCYIVDPFSAGTVFIRQNLMFVDIRF